jgi:HD-GYP domain-containing protein (c-di-GMP phosphodiesterase class II)
VGVVVAGALLTLAVLAKAAWHTAEARPTALLMFVAITVALQFLMVDVYGRGTISISGVGMLGTGLVLGPGCAMVAAIVAAGAHALVRRPLWYRAAFNTAAFSLAAGLGTLAYQDIVKLPGAFGSELFAATTASMVFTFINLGMLSTAMSLAEVISVGAVWRERFQWLTPHYVAFGPIALGLALGYTKLGKAGVVAFILPPALLSVVQRQYINRTRESVESVREANTALEHSNRELEAMADRLRNSLRETTRALSRSMEAKDSYTGGHTTRVSDVAVALAELLGFEGEALEGVEMGAILHDVGKIAIPDNILNKPGPLDDEEWRVMRTHPIVSERIVADIGLHPVVAEIARWSHERLDGKGYPDGLTGDDIPLGARIVLVADAWDALTSDRSYRKGRGAREAFAEIRDHSGTQFCPQVVAALARLYRERPELLEPEATVHAHEAGGVVIDLAAASTG